MGEKTFSTRDSRMVTHCSTNLAIWSLTRAERTGCRAFSNLWPNVPVTGINLPIALNLELVLSSPHLPPSVDPHNPLQHVTHHSRRVLHCGKSNHILTALINHLPADYCL